MSAAIENRGMVPPYLEGDKRLPMTEFLVYALVPIAIGAVAVVLLLGLSNMARGGSPHRSQKLMRLRVLLQFIAIIVIMLTIWAIGKSTDVVRDDADGDLCSTALCERSIRDGHDFDEVTSVAWTQLVVQRGDCTACQPISIGSVALMLMV